MPIERNRPLGTKRLCNSYERYRVGEMGPEERTYGEPQRKGRICRSERRFAGRNRNARSQPDEIDDRVHQWISTSIEEFAREIVEIRWPDLSHWCHSPPRTLTSIESVKDDRSLTRRMSVSTLSSPTHMPSPYAYIDFCTSSNFDVHRPVDNFLQIYDEWSRNDLPARESHFLIGEKSPFASEVHDCRNIPAQEKQTSLEERNFVCTLSRSNPSNWWLRMNCVACRTNSFLRKVFASVESVLCPTTTFKWSIFVLLEWTETHLV